MHGHSVIGTAGLVAIHVCDVRVCTVADNFYRGGAVGEAVFAVDHRLLDDGGTTSVGGQTIE